MSVHLETLDEAIRRLSPEARMRVALRLLADTAQAEPDTDISLRLREAIITLRACAMIANIRKGA